MLNGLYLDKIFPVDIIKEKEIKDGKKAYKFYNKYSCYKAYKV